MFDDVAVHDIGRVKLLEGLRSGHSPPLRNAMNEERREVYDSSVSVRHGAPPLTDFYRLYLLGTGRIPRVRRPASVASLFYVLAYTPYGGMGYNVLFFSKD